MQNRGLTVVEVLLAIVVLLVVLVVLIPGLLRARIRAGESSASAGLRSLASAQTSFQKSVSVDQDLDRMGEYGLLGELTGVNKRRGSIKEHRHLPALAVGDMPISFRPDSDGCARKKSSYDESEHYFQVFLPGPPGQIVTDSGSDPLMPLDPGTPGQRKAIDRQEHKWIAYAWPVTYRKSGVRAFVVDQNAEVYGSANTGPGNQGFWDGKAKRPAFNSAMRMTKSGTHSDETNWTPISGKYSARVNGDNTRVTINHGGAISAPAITRHAAFDLEYYPGKDNAPAVDSNHIWLPVGS